MTPEAQNEAICNALGREYHKPTQEEIAGGSYYQYQPDFTQSLDAMHEAEKVLTCEQGEVYASHIADIACGSDFWNIHATAAQRAEAFLRTLNLWDDTK